jgi:predicted acetyltransferase
MPENLIVPTDADLDEITAMMRWAFNVAEEDAHLWLDKAGLDNFRLLREDGDASGALLILDCGQYFGGRSVRMAGIAGVAVAPQHRGRGAATRLMHATMREVLERGFALSTLYPATQPLYRRAGFEQAGARYEYRLPTRSLRVPKGTVDVVPIEDQEPVLDIYREYAAQHNGTIDRSMYFWRRVRKPKGVQTRGFMTRDGKGYIFLSLPSAGKFYDVQINDAAALTPDAARTLLRLLKEHGSLSSEVAWQAGPSDWMHFMLGEQAKSIHAGTYWMLRIVDVVRALEARGWPRGLRTRLDLEIADDVLPSNEGRWRVEIEDGEASVKPGGDGRLRLDVRALAALYSSYATPFMLKLNGSLEGDQIDGAAAAFAGPAPFMSDMF